MKIHKLDGYIQTIYLIEEDEGLLLLDGASRADITLIKNYITEQLLRSIKDLKVVVVSHMHPDHAGAADPLRKLLGCLIVGTKRRYHWYRGFLGALMHMTDIFLARWVAKRQGKKRRNLWYSRKLKFDVELLDNQMLPVFKNWQVVETPGHTDRDLSIYHQGIGVIYIGDLLVKVKKGLVPPFPIFYPNRYRASLTKTNRLKPKSLLLAHGGEVKFQELDCSTLRENLPTEPKTHWRLLKLKVRQTFTKLFSFSEC